MGKPVLQIKNKIQSNYPGATVYERGRRYIKHHINGNNYVLTSTTGVIHKRDGTTEIDSDWRAGVPPTDNPWLWVMDGADYHAYAMPGNSDFDAGQIFKYVHPGTNSEIAFQPQALQWTNDLGQLEQIAAPQKVGGTVSGDAASWAGAYGAGFDFNLQSDPGALRKLINVNSAATLGNPPQFIIDGGNPRLMIPFIFQKSAGVDIWINGALWDEKANNPQTTGATVEFRTGATVLFAFGIAWARDSSKNQQINVNTRFRKSGPNLIVEIHVPWAWLETAIYPITIDPTINEEVSTGNDDGHQSGVTCTLNASLFNAWGASSPEWYAARFTTIALDGTETVTSATMDWYALSYYDCNLTIKINDVDSAAALSTASNHISSRSYWATTVTWSATLSGGYNTTPDLTTLVQHVIDRAGWASNNNMMFGMEYNSGDVQLYFQDGGASNTPQFDIVYTTGGAATGFMTPNTGYWGP